MRRSVVNMCWKIVGCYNSTYLTIDKKACQLLSMWNITAAQKKGENNNRVREISIDYIKTHCGGWRKPICGFWTKLRDLYKMITFSEFGILRYRFE